MYNMRYCSRYIGYFDFYRAINLSYALLVLAQYQNYLQNLSSDWTSKIITVIMLTISLVTGSKLTIVNVFELQNEQTFEVVYKMLINNLRIMAKRLPVISFQGPLKLF